jgi:hypothetical protein
MRQERQQQAQAKEAPFEQKIRHSLPNCGKPQILNEE